MASLIDLVKHFQHVIEKYPHDEHKVLKSIDKLYNLGVTVQHLQETGVGRTVNALRKEPGDVGNAAKALVNKWKLMVASEESSDPEDHEASKCNGHSNGRDSDDSHHQSKQSIETNVSQSSNRSQVYQLTNGEISGSKRKSDFHEEEAYRKRSRHEDEQHSKDIKMKPERHSDSDHKISDSHTYDSDCSTMSSDKDNKVKQKIKTEYQEPSTSKHSSHNENKADKTGSKKSSDKSSHSKNNEDEKKSSKYEHSSSSQKHKENKTKDDKKHASEHREKSLSSKHRSSSDKPKNCGLGKDEKTKEKSRSHSEKREIISESKHSSHKHKSDKDIQKSSSEAKAKEKHLHEHTPKDKSSSETRKRSSSKEQSHEKEEQKHLSSKIAGSSHSKHKSERSSEKKDSRKSSSSHSKSKDDGPKKKSQTTSEDSEDGVDCQSGASFADALGMMSPAKPKKKSKSFIKELSSPLNPYNDDLSPASLLAPSTKLAPLPPLEIMALPEISPNYRPRPPPKMLPHFTDEDAISAGISSKNQRTKVYSGNKTYGKLPSLYELCVNVLQEHIDDLEYTGGVPYDLLKPIIDKSTPDQLFTLEHYNPYLMEDTNHLWQKFCEKHFRSHKRLEMETWREMFLRCQEEQEVKLRSLTENIKIAQEAKKAPIKQTKMAYVDSMVKPPRNIARKQALHGTARAVSASPAARVASLAVAPDVGRAGAVRPVAAPASSLSALQRPRKAPLMQKALQFMRGGRKR